MLTELEAEERNEALALAKDVLEQYQVQFEVDGRLSVTFGGLDEDVGEWLIQIVQELIGLSDQRSKEREIKTSEAAEASMWTQ